MASKRLGRAIVECGRRAYSKGERKVRARGNRKFRLDDDGEYQPPPQRGDGRELDDRLNALERWLRSKVSRPWANVYSEFCSREDKRSLRGDHIHRHLKQMVNGAGGKEYCHSYLSRWATPCRLRLHSSWGFWVDDKGLLRWHRDDKVCQAYSKKHYGWVQPPPQPYRAGSFKDILAKEQAQRIQSGVITSGDLQDVLKRMQERKEHHY